MSNEIPLFIDESHLFYLKEAEAHNAHRPISWSVIDIHVFKKS